MKLFTEFWVNEHDSDDDNHDDKHDDNQACREM